MLRLLGYLLGALVSTSWRRIAHGPARPGWAFGFETLVTAMRGYSRWLGTLPFPQMRQEAAHLTQRPPAGVATRTETLGGLRTMRCTPEGTVSSGRVIVYLHGGGFVFGSPEQDGSLIARLALHCSAEVVAPAYRLAPENPYPAAVDDAVAAYRAVLAAGHAAPEVSLVGLSSGAGIALAALVQLRDAGERLPSSVVLLSPMVDCTASSPSWKDNAPYDWGQRDTVLAWARAYAGDRSLADSGVSPLQAELHGLPPVLVVAGDLELGRDDAVLLADKMKAAGTDVVLHLEPDMVHAFMTFDEKVAAVSQALDTIGNFVRNAPSA
jgi:epsilon-lactone hydrolase